MREGSWLSGRFSSTENMRQWGQCRSIWLVRTTPNKLRPFLRHLGSGTWLSNAKNAHHDQHSPAKKVASSSLLPSGIIAQKTSSHTSWGQASIINTVHLRRSDWRSHAQNMLKRLKNNPKKSQKKKIRQIVDSELQHLIFGRFFGAPKKAPKSSYINTEHLGK